MNSDFHRVIWGREEIQRFWEFYAGQEAGEQSYFTSTWGAEIATLLNYAVPLEDACILDFGCGVGHLARQLIANGSKVAAIEYSPKIVDVVNEQFKKEPGWLGCRLFADCEDQHKWVDYFDAVCCIEAVEHVLTNDLSRYFEDVRRYLKPGGIVLFTTPNEEDLESSMIACPECSAVFHRWQHVRRWSANELKKTLKEAGFEIMFCQGISFHTFRKPRRTSAFDLSPRKVCTGLRDTMENLMDRLDPKPFPNGRVFQRCLEKAYSYNLVTVARRPGAS